MVRVRLKAVALEAALARRNIGKTEFAKLAGIHRTHLSDMLAGRVRPGPQTRRRILEALGGGQFDEFFEIVRGRGYPREHTLYRPAE